MKHKRNRTISEKIEDCLELKIQNLHPKLKEKLSIELQTISEASSVSRCKAYVIKLLSIPQMGRHTKHYWTSRGWSEAEAHIKSKENITHNGLSPYSIEFWLSKINPITGKYYTEIEADYERNSRRPIRKEYWIKKGYSEEESISLATETKNQNNKKRSG